MAIYRFFFEPLDEPLEDFEPDFEPDRLLRAGEDLFEPDFDRTLDLVALLEEPEDFFLLLPHVFAGRWALEEVLSRDRMTLLLLMLDPRWAGAVRFLFESERESTRGPTVEVFRLPRAWTEAACDARVLEPFVTAAGTEPPEVRYPFDASRLRDVVDFFRVGSNRARTDSVRPRSASRMAFIRVFEPASVTGRAGVADFHRTWLLPEPTWQTRSQWSRSHQVYVPHQS